jgi:putative peptide zinc metalloprotease protein
LALSLYKVNAGTIRRTRIEASTPKLRTDLVISRQVENETVYYVIKDPRSGRFFRFKENEHTIASLLDGSRTPERVAEEFFRRTGTEVPVEIVGKFVEKMQSLGLLQTAGETEAPVPLDPGLWKKRPLLQKALFFKIKAIDPERLLTRIEPITRIFYSRLMIPVYVGLVFLAITVVLSNRLELSEQVKRSMRPESIIHIWLTIIALTWLHELSHALTCKRHGGRVSEFGLLLLYLQVCFYVNVSDAYLFQDKKNRIKVTLAGIKNQAVIWALAVLIWRVTEQHNFINQTAFIVTAVTFVMILFNFNPLLKLDGYYYLVDRWGIPNLRARAFGFWKAKLLKFLFKINPDETLIAREKRIFTWYGLASILYSFGLFGYILYSVTGFVWSTLGIFGLAILYGIVLYLVFEAMRKSGILAALASQRGAILRPRNWIILGVAVVVVGGLSAIIKLDLKVSQDCLIYPIESLTLKSSEPGFVESVLDRGSGEKSVQRFSVAGEDLQVLSINPLVKEGEAVRSGEVIARISSLETEAVLAESRANLDRAESQLELLRKGPRPEEIAQVQDQIEQVDMKLKKSNTDLSRAEELASKGVIPAEQLEEVRTSNEVLKSELAFYIKQKRLLKEGARPEEIEIAEAEIRAIQAKIGRLEKSMEAERIVSPIDGLVTTVRTGSEILNIARIDTMRIRIPVPEKEISPVIPGRAVKLRSRSYPGITFDGQVIRVSGQTEEGELEPIFVVTAVVANPDGLLKPGMTGHAKIYCGKRPAYKILLWRMVRWFRVEFWGWF